MVWASETVKVLNRSFHGSTASRDGEPFLLWRGTVREPETGAGSSRVRTPESVFGSPDGLSCLRIGR